jgi:hypothetical protein
MNRTNQYVRNITLGYPRESDLSSEIGRDAAADKLFLKNLQPVVYQASNSGGRPGVRGASTFRVTEKKLMVPHQSPKRVVLLYDVPENSRFLVRNFKEPR